MKQFFKKEIASFYCAFKGVLAFFRTERHARFHLFAAAGVISAGMIFHISVIDWCIVLIAIGLVLVAEIFNTAVEKLTDAIWSEKDYKAAFIKDVAAGGVLIASIIAAILGIIVFLPYLL